MHIREDKNQSCQIFTLDYVLGDWEATNFNKSWGKFHKKLRMNFEIRVESYLLEQDRGRVGGSERNNADCHSVEMDEEEKEKAPRATGVEDSG